MQIKWFRQKVADTYLAFSQVFMPLILWTFKIKEFEDAIEHLEDKQQTGACAESYHKEDVSKLQQGNNTYIHTYMCTIIILECWTQLPYTTGKQI